MAGGHGAVWGSWYDLQKKQWGYACCRSLDRNSSCSSGAPGAATGGSHGGGCADAGDGKDDSGADDSDATDSEEAHRHAAEKPFDWSGPPAELLPREVIEAQDEKPGAFVAHFVRFTIGAWRRLLEGADDGGRENDEGIDVFKNEQSFQEVEGAMEPLMRLLDAGETNPTVMQQLSKMVCLASEREYADAGKAYMDMVLGRKKWNNTLASYGGTSGTNKGARIYITKQDDLLEYDKDPVVQKYMQGLRRLVLLAQFVNPNPDTSKHM